MNGSQLIALPSSHGFCGPKTSLGLQYELSLRAKSGLFFFFFLKPYQSKNSVKHMGLEDGSKRVLVLGQPKPCYGAIS